LEGPEAGSAAAKRGAIPAGVVVVGSPSAGTETWGFSTSGGGATANVRQVTNTYNTANRLANRQTSQGTTITNTTYTYHGGNVIFESSNKGGIDPINDERASFYGADDKLLAVDWRVVGNKKVEEFRYDPLGRRVWVRFIPTCSGPGGEIGCITPSVRRTIWDGTQELAEISAPADTTNPALEELDENFPGLPHVAGAGPYGDPNPHYGRVVYSPGLAVDQPLSVTRYEYHDQPTTTATPLTWPTFTLMMFWDYRGAPAYGLFTDGAWAKPHTLGGGQTTCPQIGNDTPQRCVLFQWPMAQSAYDRNRGKIAWPVWHGSILRNKTNGTGHEYKRNRAYDGATGRFTQEDPIGLAGGLNLYGFANGDPVNFSDPFGLCPPCAGFDAVSYSYQHFAGVFDRFITKAKALGGALVDLTPVGDANRAAEAFSQGEIGKGIGFTAMAAAAFVPGERAILSGGKVTWAAAKALGLGRRDLGNRIEAIKKAAELGGTDNVIISSFGNVFRKATGEYLDNVYDVIPKK
jgi:RHS repeat-associated protein